MKNKINTFSTNFMALIRRREMSILPGHLAFFFVLSVVPIISIIVYIATSFNLPVKVFADFIEKSFSTEMAALLSPMVGSRVVSIKSIFVILVAFFLASNGADSIIIASNEVFNINSSNYLRRRVKSIVITIILIILFTFILVVPLFGSSILKLLGFFHISRETLSIFEVLYSIIKIPLSILVIFMFIKLVYTIAPDERVPSRYVNKGAVFTTISWIFMTTIYSYYVNNIASYDIYYGGLSNIIILMLWFYLMASVFVIGLVLNYRNINEYIEKTNSLKLKEINEKISKNKSI